MESSLNVINGGNRTAVVDDDLTFLETMTDWKKSSRIPLKATSEVDECREWLARKEVDIVVCDLRMPGPDGVSFLEEVRRKHPGVRLILLTGFEPTEKETERLDRIGVEVFFKTRDLSRLLELLMNREMSVQERRIVELQARVTTLEKLHEEWTEDLVAQLQSVPDLGDKIVAGAEAPFSVEELIEDIRAGTPRGVEHIRLWRRALKTLRDMGRRT